MTTKRKTTVEDVLPLFGGNRLEGNTNSRQVMTTVTGLAVSDSDDGTVSVEIGDGTITGTDDGTAVEIPTSVKVQEGDIVTVTLTGNGIVNSPLVTDVIGGGDRDYVRIELISDAAESAKHAAETAAAAAGEAQEAIDATNQHFYYDDNGVHVVTSAGDPTSGANLLANSQGIMLREGENVVSAQTRAGFATYDGKGTDVKNMTGVFGDVVRLGKFEGSQVVIDSDSLDIVVYDDKSYIPPFGSIVMNVCTQSPNQPTTLSIDDGISVQADDDEDEPKPRVLTHIGADYQSFTVQDLSVIFPGSAPADYAGAPHGQHSFSAGASNTAYGTASTAFGKNNNADGGCSFVSGENNQANGDCSLASGWNSKANGDYSMAAGLGNVAESESSIALGDHSKTNAPNQVVIGKYNSPSNTQAFIIGNGTDDDNRSNALQVGTNGDLQAAGYVKGASLTTGGEVHGGTLNIVWGSNKSISDGSAALGYNNEVTGMRSLASGMSNKVSVSDSAAFGTANTVSGSQSLAAGSDNTVTSPGAAAIGNSNSTSGYYSQSLGYGLKADGHYQTVLGRFNASDTSKMLIVGGGTKDSSRNNIFTIDTSGNVIAAGTVLDTIQSGTATLGTLVDTTKSTKYITYKKTGHIVQVFVGVYNATAISASNTQQIASGLPKAFEDYYGGAGVLTINGSSGFATAYVGSNGSMYIKTNATSIAAGKYISGSFTYISSE